MKKQMHTPRKTGYIDSFKEKANKHRPVPGINISMFMEVANVI
jgi:hypothetical protein